MTDADEPKPWLKAKIEALLHPEWIGKAGDRFRKTAESIQKYDEQTFHADEKMQDLPRVIWDTAQIKSSQTAKNIAEAEEKKIAAELARRTMTAKTRQEEAAADLAETNARIAKTQELQGRLKLVADLRDANCIPVWDVNGNMTIIPAPAGYNWDELNKSVCNSMRPLLRALPSHKPNKPPQIYPFENAGGMQRNAGQMEVTLMQPYLIVSPPTRFPLASVLSIPVCAPVCAFTTFVREAYPDMVR